MANRHTCNNTYYGEVSPLRGRLIIGSTVWLVQSRHHSASPAESSRTHSTLFQFGEDKEVVDQELQAHIQGFWLLLCVIPGRGPPNDVIGGLLVPEKSPLGGLHRVEVVKSVDLETLERAFIKLSDMLVLVFGGKAFFGSVTHSHVVLSNKCRDFQVIPANDLVQVLHTRQAVNLVLDGWCHERCKPPSHHLKTNKL